MLKIFHDLLATHFSHRLTRCLLQRFEPKRGASGNNVGAGILPVGARRRHTARYRSAGRVGVSPFSSHVSEYLLRFAPKSVTGNV